MYLKTLCLLLLHVLNPIPPTQQWIINDIRFSFFIAMFSYHFQSREKQIEERTIVYPLHLIWNILQCLSFSELSPKTLFFLRCATVILFLVEKSLKNPVSAHKKVTPSTLLFIIECDKVELLESAQEKNMIRRCKEGYKRVLLFFIWNILYNLLSLLSLVQKLFCSLSLKITLYENE